MRAYYNEFDPFAANWLRNLIASGLIADGDVDERSIVDVQPSDLDGYTQHHFFAGIGGWSYALRLAGWPDTRPVITASCPCQPFSNGGKMLGTNDDRHLWPAFRWLLKHMGDAVMFGEQVASKMGRRWLEGVRADLGRMGRRVGAADIPGVAVGARHIRPRFWIVADREGVDGVSHDRVVEGGIGGASQPARGLLGLDVSGRWWSSDARTERMPTLVRNFNGLSGTLAGFGNAIVPQVAAEFITAYIEATGDNPCPPEASPTA